MQTAVAPKVRLEEIPSSHLFGAVAAKWLPRVGGHAVFALRDVAIGEPVAIFGGTAVSYEALKLLRERGTIYALQVDEDVFLVSDRVGPADYINHSCAPNTGLAGPIHVVARTPIAAGEEVTFDYAMSDGCDYDEFDCRCGATECRGRVRGDDWRLPSLQRRYAGYFSPYLAQRIPRTRWTLRAGGRTARQAI